MLYAHSEINNKKINQFFLKIKGTLKIVWVTKSISHWLDVNYESEFLHRIEGWQLVEQV